MANPTTNFDIGIQPNRYPNAAKSRVFYTRTVAPTIEPLTLEEAQRQCQTAVADDNAYIMDMVRVARDVAENATGRALMRSTWRAVTGEWPRCGMLGISVAPLAEVTEVKYYADGETELTTLAEAGYTFSTDTSPAVIIFTESFDRPALADRPDAIQVTFTAGATNPRDIPPALKHAVRILTRHFYDNPAAAVGGTMHELPIHLRHLLESERVAGWVA